MKKFLQSTPERHSSDVLAHWQSLRPIPVYALQQLWDRAEKMAESADFHHIEGAKHPMLDW